MTVAVLFADPKGSYAGLPDVELWDEARDARLYAGPHPVVAHPPCSAWSMMAPVNAKRYGHAVGDDGYCFASALASVRHWGGVLEHPRGSFAWHRYCLPRPTFGAWVRDMWNGQWATEVWQGAYGHRARKATWLLYCGAAPPLPMDWSRPRPTATCSWLANKWDAGLPRLCQREASATPPAFRDALLQLARQSIALPSVGTAAAP